jgi:hypothetical protein
LEIIRGSLKFLRMVSDPIEQIDDEEDHGERVLQVYEKGADRSTSGF